MSEKKNIPLLFRFLHWLKSLPTIIFAAIIASLVVANYTNWFYDIKDALIPPHPLAGKWDMEMKFTIFLATDASIFPDDIIAKGTLSIIEENKTMKGVSLMDAGELFTEKTSQKPPDRPFFMRYCLRFENIIYDSINKDRYLMDIIEDEKYSLMLSINEFVAPHVDGRMLEITGPYKTLFPEKFTAYLKKETKDIFIGKFCAQRKIGLLAVTIMEGDLKITRKIEKGK